jgi:ubiquinone/menaquinone biosynthesis C-methylase UbiE
MERDSSKVLRNTLTEDDIHRKWVNTYRTEKNQRFYEMAFDAIVREINPPEGAMFLDAGCGSCQHSMRLARRGFRVTAVDFSRSALSLAMENIRSKGMTDRITLTRQDLTALSFPSATFDYILCWGVLMHIHDVRGAILELSRVLKPGGYLVISENNAYSVQSMLIRSLKSVLRPSRNIHEKHDWGFEYWEDTPVGRLLTRQNNIPGLLRLFRENGMSLEKRFAGQFTELYSMFHSSILQAMIHYFNSVWFRHIRVPYLSFGNILIMRSGG